MNIICIARIIMELIVKLNNVNVFLRLIEFVCAKELCVFVFKYILKQTPFANIIHLWSAKHNNNKQCLFTMHTQWLYVFVLSILKIIVQFFYVGMIVERVINIK